jgi:hypothetical protein
MSTRHEPPPRGLELRVLDIDPTGKGVASLRNQSLQAVWVSPPQLELWEGPRPWIEGAVKDGRLRLGLGEELTEAFMVSRWPARLGVRVWASDDTKPGETNLPWFLWTELTPPVAS